MEKEDKEKLGNHIRERIAGLKEDIASYELLTKPVAPDNAIGRLTRMDAIHSKSINEAALSKSKAALSRFEQVLHTIDDPDFGLCMECEEPIPYKRLITMPGTKLCVPCAEKIEE